MDAAAHQQAALDKPMGIRYFPTYERRHLMNIKTINPNLTQITRFHFVNAFLVREETA